MRYLRLFYNIPGKSNFESSFLESSNPFISLNDLLSVICEGSRSPNAMFYWPIAYDRGPLGALDLQESSKMVNDGPVAIGCSFTVIGFGVF